MTLTQTPEGLRLGFEELSDLLTAENAVIRIYGPDHPLVKGLEDVEERRMTLPELLDSVDIDQTGAHLLDYDLVRTESWTVLSALYKISTDPDWTGANAKYMIETAKRRRVGFDAAELGGTALAA